MSRALWIYVTAFVFAWWQNRYFGHNPFPASDAELIADGLVLLMVTIGLATSAIEARS